tara:strand:- start:1720 stop:2145 length:426 start_codon:yes stop_codon:yes gene_type:complete
VKIKYSLLLFLFVFQTIFSQENYVSDEEFKSRISWLLPSEEILPFSDNLNKVRGYNKRRGGFQVDGILYSNLPFILSSRVKYIEIPEYTNSTSLISKCDCSLIIKTIVTEKEFKSKKNVLHRLNKNKTKDLKKKKKKKKKN